ncbi:Ubiquitin-binding protein CUE5 [Escovopsis weberi]|uniref:Ubiquitin-binding protein CUE5 n=1 Tax=Escovopsis weberi TaxID=150374 RepID=A0A0M8MZG7_ESCWE|nr:Ubiquitin-binding protein CUE5 [Escovopsis weberi]
MNLLASSGRELMRGMQNKPVPGAESPTTARPLEMDDDDVQESGVTATDRNAAPTDRSVSTADALPPKPPRPVTDAQKNMMMLKEAFPSVDDNVIKAVLSASRGHVESAFDALLEMTDPDAVKNEPEDNPPQQPPRPSRAQMSQMEADEIYARQLAEQYENVGSYEARTSNSGGSATGNGGSGERRSRVQPQYGAEERERSFMDDDLPQIKEGLRQGFLETQTRVNGWINTLKKKIEENFDENEDYHEQVESPRRGHALPKRRSQDYNRYDADPQVLGDDFAGLKLTVDGSPAFNNRPLGNTSIYRPPPSTSPRRSGEKRVGFKDEPEEINMYEHSPKATARDATPLAGGSSNSSNSRASKWQPLSTVDPTPISDNDPFSLGDSEDEREAKEKTKPESKQDDAERLKQSTADAMS